MDDYSENYALSFCRKDADGITTVNTTFTAEYLPTILGKIRDFLCAAGFTYVDSVSAFSGEDVEHSSEDI